MVPNIPLRNKLQGIFWQYRSLQLPQNLHSGLIRGC
ncbi:hypothetical protein LINGRAHAP2_LOCUS5164 [Linum grandiflorum]